MYHFVLLDNHTWYLKPETEQKKKDAVRKRELSELKRLQEKYKDEL